MTDQTHINLYFVLDNSNPTIGLSIPVTEILHFTRSPLKWLRYLGYVIYGAEGQLSETAGGVAVDYQRAQVDDLRASYYYVPDTQSAPCCLIDAVVNRTHSTNSSTISEPRHNFRNTIMSRDGCCIMTGVNPLQGVIEACHIIPHMRGSEYIERLTRIRTSERKVISNINDPQNGVFLANIIHSEMDLKRVAFLKTPNFALETADVQLVPPIRFSGEVPHLPQNPASPVLCLQHFAWIPLLNTCSPRNAYAIPLENRDIPPMSTALLDYNYGVAAVSMWAPDEFKRLCAGLAKLHYDPDTPSDPPSEPRNSDSESRPQEPAKPQKSDKERRYNHWKRRSKANEGEKTVGGNGGDAGYDYHDMLLGLRMYTMREQIERAEREKKRVNEMMVNEWRATVSKVG
ncbi:hypothetical protein SCHPADRAFT_993671 [Schizopora paradoxa]|uniref:HNH nuclease domain-containing protein n=1 Tax=Schizopora paradoxa TaxID=27342 RepID=A0A0H2SMB6_9AGAM|nr:hypothetical protein SCHPADRAFT_993671 [Schizopora paradoxa]